MLLRSLEIFLLYGTPRFVTVLTKARHLSVPSARLTPTTFFHTLLNTCLCFPAIYARYSTGFLPSGLLQNPYSIRATCPSHPMLLDLTTQTVLGKEYKSWSSPLWNFLQSPVTYSLDPNVFPSSLLSNTLNLCDSLSLRDQVSYPYKTTSKTVVTFILIFLLSRRKKILCRMVPSLVEFRHSLV